MKKYLLTALALISVVQLSAQSFDTKMIGFKPSIFSQSAPDNVVTFLDGKIVEVLTAEGLASTSSDFELEVIINELNKSVTPTAPMRMVVELEVIFSAKDISQNMIFNSMSVNVKGIASSEGAAYMSAIRRINFRTRNFLNFMEVSKKKLYDYYEGGYAKVPEEETTPEYIPEPIPQPEVTPEPVPMPEIEPEPTPEPENYGAELSSGVYVNYIRYENKASSTDLILTLTNTNINDEAVDLAWISHLVVDSNGKNISSHSISYLDGSGIPNNKFTLINGVPVTIRIKYGETLTPMVLYFYERSRDTKLRINCK